jgi:hypothetical protein
MCAIHQRIIYVFCCETFEEASWTSGTANKTMTFQKKVICATMQHLFGTSIFFGLEEGCYT